MMNRIFQSVLLLMLPVSVCMAEARLTLDKTTYDFGIIQESDGDVTAEFSFTNTGDTPLLITRAASSCGCTVPEYTKKPIRPGESGVISVTYHAKGRPGPFQKTVKIYDNTDVRSQVTIMGTVVNNTKPEDTYVNEMGAGLRSKTRTMNFFDVYPNKNNRTRTLQFYNDSDVPVELTFQGVSKNIALQPEPSVIQPGEEGKVLVTFLTNKTKDWGMHNETFTVYVKGKEAQMHNNVVTVTADIWEDFSGLSRKERELAGEIELSDTQVEMSSTGGGTVEKVITIRNTGKQKLTIRKVSNDLPEAFKVELQSAVIKAGQSTDLKITFVPSATTLRQLSHHIMVISNDPSNSRVIININATK